MRLMQLAILAATCGFASAATAAPCVTASFDRPLPGANNVVSHVADVPSVQFPAFWQEGRIEGFAYKIFSNSEGFLRSVDPDQGWTIAIVCDAQARNCDLATDGAPPLAATEVARVLGQCLVGEDIPADRFRQASAPVATETTEPQVVTVRPTETQMPAATAPPPRPCGLSAVSEANEIATMQRLLLLAGQDPGLVDGFLGPQTFKAMDFFVEDADWDTSIAEVIILLDALLCEG